MPKAPIYRQFVKMMKLLHIYLNHFPAHENNALTNRIKNNAYEVFDLIVEGQKSYYSKTTLSKIDKAHEKLRMGLWLAYDLGYFNYKDNRKSKKNLEKERYPAINREVDELGRMIGGWINKIKNQNKWK